MRRWRFSPHARGCSVNSGPDRLFLNVFPACAGMFLYSSSRSRNRSSFPRMRGDVPTLSYRTARTLIVFPACAGMFLTTPGNTSA